MDRLELRSDRVAWEVVDDRVVGLDLGSSEYFSLNATGTMLWQALAGGAAPDDLVDQLVDRYSIGRAQAADDVDRFVAALRARGLVDP